MTILLLSVVITITAFIIGGITGNYIVTKLKETL